jgi:hypothetical protein
MEHDDSRFESFLREFQPRRPRVLPALVERKAKVRRLAAAAAVLAATGASTWFAIHETPPNGYRSMRPPVEAGPDTKFSSARPACFSLTQLAVEDPKRFDAELTEQSRRVLPDFRDKESTLRVLSKE